MAWAVRRPVVALLAWVVLLVGLGVAATLGGGKPNDSFALPGVQSTTAQALLEKLGGTGPSDPSGTVVWSPLAGAVTQTANQAAAVALLTKIATEPFVLCVTGPFHANYGRSCPKPQPNDLAAALNDAVAAQIAVAFGIEHAGQSPEAQAICRIAAQVQELLTTIRPPPPTHTSCPPPHTHRTSWASRRCLAAAATPPTPGASSSTSSTWGRPRRG